MKSFLQTFRRGALALGLSIATAVPVVSTPAVSAPLAPIAQPSAPAAQSDVVQVRDRRYYGRGYNRGWNRGYNRDWRRHHRRDRTAAAAIGLGLGLGALALAARPRYYEDRYYYDEPVYVAPRRAYRAHGLSRAHVDWCYNRYRSYRAYDNSFQPYNGPRQACYSPYG